MAALSIVAAQGLTQRRMEMIDCFSRGMSQREIAARYGLCVGSVKSEKHQIIAIIGRSEFRRRVFLHG